MPHQPPSAPRHAKGRLSDSLPLGENLLDDPSVSPMIATNDAGCIGSYHYFRTWTFTEVERSGGVQLAFMAPESGNWALIGHKTR